MNTLPALVNYTVLALLALAFIGITLSCLLLIVRNVRQGRVVRQHLAKQIESSRINAALSLFDVESSEYLHSAPLNKVVENIDHCDECVSPWCNDDVSAHPAAQERKFYFCPITNHFMNASQAQ